LRSIYWILLTAISVSAFENHEAKDDDAAIQVDTYLGFPKQIDSVSGDIPFSRIYGYSFFPLTKIAGNDLVGGAEFSILPREFNYQGSTLNGKILQGYGLGLGYETIHTEKQEGFAYGLLGINGDMRDLGPKNLYGDLSYTHQFNLSKRLMIGGGIDVHFYFNDYFPYPVILLDWQIAEHTKVKINWDTGELKQFLSENFSVALGAQYDIFHYGFGREDGYVMETISSMAKVEYRLGEDIYARLSAKKPFWGGETVWTATGGAEKKITDDEGVSVRFQVAYGI
jgi:hypothetical protein